MNFNFSINNPSNNFEATARTHISTKNTSPEESISRESILEKSMDDDEYDQIAESLLLTLKTIHNTTDLIKAQKSKRGRPTIPFSKVMMYTEFLYKKFPKYVSEAHWNTVDEDCIKEGIQPIPRNTFKRSFLHLRQCPVVSLNDKYKLTRIANKLLRTQKFDPNTDCELCKHKKDDKPNLFSNVFQNVDFESSEFDEPPVRPVFRTIKTRAITLETPQKNYVFDSEFDEPPVRPRTTIETQYKNYVFHNQSTEVQVAPIRTIDELALLGLPIDGRAKNDARDITILSPVKTDSSGQNIHSTNKFQKKAGNIATLSRKGVVDQVPFHLMMKYVQILDTNFGSSIGKNEWNKFEKLCCAAGIKPIVLNCFVRNFQHLLECSKIIGDYKLKLSDFAKKILPRNKIIPSLINKTCELCKPRFRIANSFIDNKVELATLYLTREILQIESDENLFNHLQNQYFIYKSGDKSNIRFLPPKDSVTEIEKEFFSDFFQQFVKEKEESREVLDVSEYEDLMDFDDSKIL